MEVANMPIRPQQQRLQVREVAMHMLMLMLMGMEMEMEIGSSTAQ
jgi:hypothetical protein